MTSYRKTMGQAMQEMYSINEDNEEVSLELDETSSLAQQAAIAISEKEHGNKPKKEEVDLDEAKMSSAQIAKLKKAYEPMRDKRISTDNANKLNAMMDKVGKDKEALIQLFKADIPFVSQSAVTKLISKHNMKGAEINKLREEFNIESVDLDEGKILVADPKTQKVTKIDEKDWPEYEKKGYVQAEEVDLDEAEDFKPHKMYDPETGKAYDAKTMDDHLKYKKMGYSHEKPEVEESAASDARRAIALDPSTKQKFSKNVSASDDDVKSADKNIMMQMRKAVSLRGNKVEFMDKKKMEIPQKVAQAVLDKYNSQKRPADKEKFQTKVSKSYKDMLQALKETNEKMDTFHEVKSLMRKFRENNNG